jgi:hypothetical protein
MRVSETSFRNENCDKYVISKFDKEFSRAIDDIHLQSEEVNQKGMNKE